MLRRTVRCDRCTVELSLPGADRDILLDAKPMGWRFTLDEDLCPSCAGNVEQIAALVQCTRKIKQYECLVSKFLVDFKKDQKALAVFRDSFKKLKNSNAFKAKRGKQHASE